MSRINGIGTTYLGISQPDQQNYQYATLWFTLLYLPILPFERHKVQFIGKSRWHVFAKTPLVAKEILQTYLFGWIIYPLLLFGPLFIAVKEVRQSINIPDSLEMPTVFFAIFWLTAMLLLLSTLHQRKWRLVAL